MNIGKVPVNVLKRSILRQINNNRNEVVSGAAIGHDYAAIRLSEGETLVTSTCPAAYRGMDMGYYAVHSAVNNIYAGGADAVAIMLSILYPEGTEESSIKEVMNQAEKACKMLDIQIVGGHSEISDAVNRIIINVTAYGKAENDKLAAMNPNVGDDIVLTKYIGIEGTAIIAATFENELKSHFSAGYINSAMKLSEMVSVKKEANTALQYDVTSMHDLSGGGLFAALYELSEASSHGLNVNMSDICIKQETVEIAEYYGINPYELLSGGSLLVTTKRGHDYVRALEQLGINARVIGKITRDKDRVIVNGDEKRFLNRISGDELYKVI